MTTVEPITDEAAALETDQMFADRRHGNCCFCSCFPRFRSSSSSWWRRVMAALMKLREWSELAAGPRWKTFLRRFNKNGGNQRDARFQYDPLSYALNFDDGPNEDYDDEALLQRSFSARFASFTPAAAAKMASSDPGA